MKKNRILFLGMLVMVLAFGLVLTGCGDDGGGGPVALPANLKNTTWNPLSASYDFQITFKETTVGQYAVWSAKPNGKITVKLGDSAVWQYMDEETFCDSYSISGTTLTLIGGEVHDWMEETGAYIKQ
jgi:hypothetical protein